MGLQWFVEKSALVDFINGGKKPAKVESINLNNMPREVSVRLEKSEDFPSDSFLKIALKKNETPIEEFSAYPIISSEIRTDKVGVW